MRFLLKPRIMSTMLSVNCIARFLKVRINKMQHRQSKSLEEYIPKC